MTDLSKRDMAADIVAKIKTLSPLPMAARRLCSLAEDVNTDLKTIDQVISSDQALAGRLLRITNSAFYGLSRRVTTISQAVVVIGFHGVKNLALSVALCCEHATDKSPAYAEFWRHNLAVACAARRLAAPLHIPVPEENFTAGLLHDIGALVMMEHFTEQYETILRQAAVGATSLPLLERHAFNIDHCRVGAELCRHWQIPELITGVVATHHNPAVCPEKSMPVQVVTLAVQIANLYANIAGLGADGDPLDNPALRRLAAERLPPDFPRQLMAALPDEVHVVENLLDVPSNPNDRPARLPETVLRISDDDTRDLLELILTAWGCAPCRDISSDAPTALIADAPPSAAGAHVKFVDAGGMPAPAASGMRHLGKLREWLADALDRAV